MVASGAVYEALSPLFDSWSGAVMVVSGYDHTILYANPAAAPALQGLSPDSRMPAIPIELAGRTLEEVLDLYGVDVADSAFLRCLGSGACEALEHDGSWRVASLLRPSDDSRMAFGSIHETAAEEVAREAHATLAQRANIAIEFAEAERLIHVGMEALHRARQRLNRARLTALAPPDAH